MVDATIRLVAQRRRRLEAFAQTSPDAQVTGRLPLSPETVLDQRVSLAPSMLREKMDIPRSLDHLSPSYSTVYHIQ